MGDYFAIEADTRIDIVRVTWIKIVFEQFYLIGIFIKLCHLNENYYFLSICFIIGIRKYVIKKVIYYIGNTIPWACYQQWL